MVRRAATMAGILILVLALLASACAKTAPTAGKPVVLKAVSAFPIGNENGNPLVLLADKVKRKSNGELTINITGGPEVIPPFDQGAAVKNGAVDLSHVFSAAYSGAVPIVLTLTVSQLSAAEERSGGYYDFLAEQHKKAGLFYLGRGSLTDPSHRFFYIWVSKKIDRPDQLARLKIGAPSPASDSFLKALGAVPTSIGNWAEFYVATQTGVIDGFWFTITDVVNLNLQELPLFMIDHAYFNDNTTFIMNPGAWDRLSPAHQKLLREAVIEVENEHPKIFREQLEKPARDKMLAAKVKTITFSAADTKAFTDLAFKAEWDEQAKRNPELAPKAKELLKIK